LSWLSSRNSRQKILIDLVDRPFGKEKARKHAAQLAGTKLLFSISTPLTPEKMFYSTK
jgi:hypothetical protein